MNPVSSDLFENFSDVFEASINWPRRLAHEGPFYRQLFARRSVETVLDAACGPGHHAAMFSQWGLRTQGADASAAMIQRAQANFGTKPGLSWQVRKFQEPPATAFDAVICVGNSLALAGNRAAAEQGLKTMLAAAAKLLVIHLANMSAWPDGPCLWQKCLRANLPAGPALCIKGVHRSGARPLIEFLVIPEAAEPKLQSRSTELLLLSADELTAWGRAAGAARVAIHGGYAGETYAPATSVDLIAVFEK